MSFLHGSVICMEDVFQHPWDQDVYTLSLFLLGTQLSVNV